jgi:hypothetical protein
MIMSWEASRPAGRQVPGAAEHRPQRRVQGAGRRGAAGQREGTAR